MLINAQLWDSPATICAKAPPRPVTAVTAVTCVTELPKPICPRPLLPQQLTLPSLLIKAHEWYDPNASWETGFPTKKDTNVGLDNVAVALPGATSRLALLPQHCT